MNRIKNSLVVLFLLVAFNVKAQTNVWPHEIKTEKGAVIIMYQPQPESLSGNVLEARAAVSVKTKNDKDPVFGAIWMSCRLNTDRETRKASLESIKVRDVRFPNNPDTSKIRTFKNIVETEVPKWNLVIDMDALASSLETENSVNQKAEKIKNDAPKIYYEKSTSVLIILDGPAKLQDIEKTGVKRIVNTPATILQDQDDKKYYLNGNGIWYASSTLESGWLKADKLPKAIKKISDDLIKSGAIANPDSVDNSVTPKIIVSTVPADLIQTDGDAQMTPISGTNLLYAKNSEDDIFMDISSQQYYIIVAGRWYKSSSMNGPWTFVSADNIPVDFANIPIGSEKDNVLANVAGTEQSISAKRDAQVPQTATVDRKTTSSSVSYDGEPKFEAVAGTNDLMYAVNTSSSVLKYQNRYYLVDKGIWFVANNPQGSWAVSTERPASVDNIEPESPVYNVKFVYIYESTPEVVYVGYTPGYMGCYVYGPTIVYGTGYYYQPWYGAYYYPRPVTYGLHVHYNPWTGWSVGVSMAIGGPYGWMAIGIHTYPPYWGPHYVGFYGPHGHYPPPYYHCNHHYGHSTVVINNVNVRNNNYHNRNNANISHHNMYKNQSGVRTSNVKNSNMPVNSSRGNNASKPSNMASNNNSRPNNVYADKSGNVYKGNSASSMEKHNGSNWEKPAANSPAQNMSGNQTQNNRANTSQMDRQVQSRNNSATSSQNFNSFQQQSGGFNRGGGGARSGGGGGRRR